MASDLELTRFESSQRQDLPTTTAYSQETTVYSKEETATNTTATTLVTGSTSQIKTDYTSEIQLGSDRAPSTPDRDIETENRAHEPKAIPVPRLKRRGLLGQITIIPEVDNPRAYSRTTKWILTWTVSLATLIAPMGTSIFYRM